MRYIYQNTVLLLAFVFALGDCLAPAPPPVSAENMAMMQEELAKLGHAGKTVRDLSAEQMQELQKNMRARLGITDTVNETKRRMPSEQFPGGPSPPSGGGNDEKKDTGTATPRRPPLPSGSPPTSGSGRPPSPPSGNPPKMGPHRGAESQLPTESPAQGKRPNRPSDGSRPSAPGGKRKQEL